MGDSVGKIVLVLDKRRFAGEGASALLASSLPSYRVMHAASLDELAPAAPGEICLAIVSYGAHRSVYDYFDEITQAAAKLSGTALASFGGPTDPEQFHHAAKLGIRGFFSESASIEVISAACQLVIAGEPYVSGEFMKFGVEPIGRGQPNTPSTTAIADIRAANSEPARLPQWGLTNKEFDVLHSLAKGQPNKTIASQLSIAENTVKIHIRSILRKLGASNRTEAVVFANQRHLIDNN